MEKYADTDIEWINILYDWCVNLLVHWAFRLGITYEEINIYLFVFILPALLLISLIVNLIVLKNINNQKEKK